MIIWIIILLIVIYLFSKKESFSNICSSNLTDAEFLEHMIPHHQVAIDISKVLQKQTKNTDLQKILRELIWTQETEIKLMEMMLAKLSSNISDSNIKMNKIYLSTISDFIEPNKLKLTKTECDPLFFDVEEHRKHLHHVTDESYIEHMIPHHQVAVDMSKILLKNTNNDPMIWLAYRIIRSQQGEIIILDNLKKSTYKSYSNLIL